jgi:serine/threonine-protein kinase RsbW
VTPGASRAAWPAAGSRPRPVPAPGCVPRDPAARDHRWPERWRRGTHLELAALDTAPGSARAHVRAVLREWHADGDAAETATLIVSELLTNAIESTWEHRRYDPVHLWVLGDRSSVLFLVWDATVRPPVLAAPAPGDEHGRGLALVDGLCERWGHYYPAEEPFGKVVWALMHAVAGPVWPPAGSPSAWTPSSTKPGPRPEACHGPSAHR